MKNTYYQISADEFFRWFLQRVEMKMFTEEQYRLDLGFWRELYNSDATKITEMCAVIPLSEKYCLKIYSGIGRKTKTSRPKGHDSIKIVVANINTFEPVRKKITHTYRGMNWKKNLTKNLKEALISLYGKEQMKCRKKSCNGILTFRKNQKSREMFFGCSKSTRKNPCPTRNLSFFHAVI
jgi:hypothetical protein